MATLPVWFLQAGQSEGSAVLVWVQPVGNRVTEKRLLTAQHVLRPSEDKRNGSYPSKIRAWPPDVGFLSDKRFDLELDLVLTPSDATPLVNAEDFAFLKIPPEATGATPSGLLTDAVCIVGLSDLNIVGYTNGQALIDLDGVVRPAPHPGWKYEKHVEPSASGILSSGVGQKLGGVSGGGVFHSGQYAGVYRGAFEALEQHLFIPLSRIRVWCLEHGYELLDLSVGGRIEVIKEQLTGLAPLMNDPVVKPLIESSRQELNALHAVLSEFRIYKLLHDHLHKVQFQFPSAAKAARGDLTDDDTLTNFELAIHAIELVLPGTARTMSEIQGDALRLRESVWLRNLQKYTDQAKKAAQAPREAKEACGEIGAILKKDLPRINGVLSDSAQAMDVERLGTLFGDISAVPTLTAVEQEAFRQGQGACVSVRQSLDQQTSLHSKWQKLDVQLWDAESALIAAAAPPPDGDPANFLEQWQDIDQALQGLMADSRGADWAIRVAAGLTASAPLIANGSWLALFGKFDRLARDLRQQFFDIDDELKRKAEKISELGKPLDPLL